jgi:hypothetical protein
MSMQRMRPWRNALMATTGLALFFIFSSSLWQAGYQEWAFLLFFLAVWVVISISWSNIRFAEESGTILAGIVDRNFENLQRKVEHLEAQLQELRTDFGTGNG